MEFYEILWGTDLQKVDFKIFYITDTTSSLIDVFNQKRMQPNPCQIYVSNANVCT